MTPSWFNSLLTLPIWKMVGALLIVGAFAAAALGEVITLGDDSFDNYVDKLPPEALLMVDFFKPGCKHCLRLRPVLEYLEAEWEKEEPDASRRWFKLAKVDCEQNPRLKAVFGIGKVPDLRFVRDGHWNTYEGPGTVEAISDFKDRMAVIPLPSVSGEELLERLSTEEAVFVLAMKAEADAASDAPGVLIAAAVRQHTAAFCALSEELLSSLGLEIETLPALVKVVSPPDGQSGILPVSSFEGDISRASSWSLLEWVEKSSYGLLSEFTADNFSRFGSLGKLLVIGIIDPRDEKTPAFKHALWQVASGLGRKHHDQLIFGTLNGATLGGFVESLGIFDGLPRVVVLDITLDQYYAVEDLQLDPAPIEAFIIDVMSGGVPAKGYVDGTMRYMMKIWWFIEQGGAWSLLLLIPLFGVICVFLDTPEAEERRAAVRDAKRAAREEEEKQDGQGSTDHPKSD